MLSIRASGDSPRSTLCLLSDYTLNQTMYYLKARQVAQAIKKGPENELEKYGEEGY